LKAVVTGVDVYRWVEDGEIKEAVRGDEIEVTETEYKRSPGALSKAGSKAAKAAKAGSDGETTPAGWPTSHEDIDALAEKNDVSFDQHVRTLSEKVTALEQAGVSPPSA
jgi:hypothetical protein